MKETGPAEQDRVRVLLVDDDADELPLIEGLLRQQPWAQFEVEWAGDFDSGLDRMLAGGHDAYLVDYRLGSRSGIDLIRRATDAQVEGPLILLTGVGDREVDRAACDAGAAGYLHKRGLDGVQLERTLRYATRSVSGEQTSDPRRSADRPNDLVLQASLARGDSVVAAAQRAGVSERTVYRRLADPVFNERLEAMRERIRSRLVETIASEMVATGDRHHVDA